jgi:hypothetical protein
MPSDPSARLESLYVTCGHDIIRTIADRIWFIRLCHLAKPGTSSLSADGGDLFVSTQL